jgi:hypothetical protein
MKSYVAHEDVEQWLPLVEWLKRPRGRQSPPAAGDDSPGALPGALPAAVSPLAGAEDAPAPEGGENDCTPLSAALAIG